MSRNQLIQKAYNFGIFCFLVLISIGYIATTNDSRQLILICRSVSAAGVLAAIALSFMIKGVTKAQFYPIVIYFLLMIWGVGLSNFYSVATLDTSILGMNLLVTLSGLLLIGSRPGPEILENRMASGYALYVVIGLAITIFIGGIEFGFPPRFVLDYVSDSAGYVMSYSQAMSQFFGYGAVASIFAAQKTSSYFRKSLYIFVTVLCLCFSLLGGARGDSLAAIFVVFVFALTIKEWRAYLFILTIAVIVLVSTLNFTWMSDIVIFQRLAVLGNGDLGERDILLSQAFDLLIARPHCLTMGCGIEYFQKFYGYGRGLYPHNFIVEFVITYGLGVFVAGVVLSTMGAWRYYNRVGRLDFFMWLFIYAFLCDMKSGALFDGWLVAVTLLYFAGLGLSSKRKFENSRQIALTGSE